MIAPAEWIKRNMMGAYSEELGRPLTEAELRVQRCLERMPVPEWYQKYSRPPNFLKNCTPFECRPASWKTYRKSKVSHTPRKPVKKRSFGNSPDKSESESSRTSTADSGYNEACRGSRRTPKKKKNCSVSSGTESESPKIDEDVQLILNGSNKSFRSRLNVSNSFPRMSRSRKIENINIVFSKPFPNQAETQKPAASTPKTVYTMTKNLEMQRDGEDGVRSDSSSATVLEKTHTSFLIAEVEPSGVTTRVQVFAGPLTSDSSGSSDEEQPRRCSPSPDIRFFNSKKKSMALEKIVQSRRTDSGNRSLIQEIIDELDRSSGGGSGGKNGSPTGASDGQNFVRSMVSALEQSCCYNSEEEEEEEEDEDRQSNGSSDSELAKSTSISFKSYEPDSADEQPSSPLPALSSAGEYCYSGDEEEEIYWIPCKSRQLPRTSSQLSMMSKGRRSGQNSPGLSPIKMERREDWLQKQAIWGLGDKAPSRQLFRIDETGVADSGYSDRSSTIASSSRTATLTSERSTGRSPSPSSASSSPTMLDYESTRLPLSRSAAYVMKSFLV